MTQSLPSQALKTTAPVLDRPRASRAVLWRSSQWVFCRFFQIPIYFTLSFMLRYVGGYTIENMQEVRKAYRESTAFKGPLIICSNHLTFIDSMLIIWAFGSNLWYAFNFSRFSWNLPAGDFFKKKLHYRFLAAIAKCIFIHRDGSKDHKNAVVSVCGQLLSAGETITFFPEGRRSRTGRFENDKLTYGVAKLVHHLHQCPVMCVYLRSDKQETYSGYPPRNSHFSIKFKMLQITPRAKDKEESYRQIMGEIGQTIQGMENDYFSGKTAKAP